jgi:hypothetical protein
MDSQGMLVRFDRLLMQRTRQLVLTLLLEHLEVSRIRSAECSAQRAAAKGRGQEQ